MQVDWSSWKPQQRAVLCYLIQGERVLLIHKKTGLGAGLVNVPGGRIQPDEKPEIAAIREMQEEVGLIPKNLIQMGELSFQFTDGLGLHCLVYRADSYEGELMETREATPFWSDVDAIPYNKMWSDDAFWLPRMLDGYHFKGYFTFDAEHMISAQLS